MKKSLSPVVPSVKENIEPGAILVCSWGYDQTNIDFYCVLKVENGWVTLQAMKQESSEYEGGYMTSKETPTGLANDKPFRRKYKGSNWVRINSYSGAHIWKGKAMTATHYA